MEQVHKKLLYASLNSAFLQHPPKMSTHCFSGLNPSDQSDRLPPGLLNVLLRKSSKDERNTPTVA
ncbi:predicted protein [Botrytis cinerea T4]|uniref:Uncharacterized protein n=1 Tax=Botryotinia fuckeliana (strain T4) TaxID=999810 RepID=G2YNL1_BOTF4|nr:predicted protein [Botrytis cinerea T4]